MEEINQLEYKLKKSKENLQADIANRRIDKIDNISIDSNTSLESRILNFFQKIKNPYAIRVGNIVVEMEFSDNSNIWVYRRYFNKWIQNERNVKCVNFRIEEF